MLHDNDCKCPMCSPLHDEVLKTFQKQDSDAKKRRNEAFSEFYETIDFKEPLDFSKDVLRAFDAGRASMRAEILKNIESIFTKNILRGEDWNLCLTCDQVMNVLKMESKND